MAIKRPLPLPSRVNTDYHYDPAENRVTIHQWQDAEKILEYNKKKYNSEHRGYSKSKELQHVARIPKTLYMKWLLELPPDLRRNQDAINKMLKIKLNDRDNRKVRCSPGVF